LLGAPSSSTIRTVRAAQDRALAREEAAGPVTLRVQLLMYRRCDRQNRPLGRSWVAVCRTGAAVRYVRARLHDLMCELDGVRVVGGRRSRARFRFIVT
jgi:hypothetical protein